MNLYFLNRGDVYDKKFLGTTYHFFPKAGVFKKLMRGIEVKSIENLNCTFDNV